MKVLLVNWSWYPTGGDWTYVSNVKTLYEKNGYDTIPFSTANEKNNETPYSEYFIDAPDYKLLNKKRNIMNGMIAVKNSIVSSQALKKIDQILKEHDIKIAHLHNIHHYITPAIIWRLKKANVKIIWTLHDYQIICPQSLFISHGKICERCINGRFYQCTLHKCKRNSRPISMLASAEAYFYHKTGTYKKVDAFLCPSRFIKKKFNQFGFEDSKLHVTNLCYDISLVDNFINDYNQRLRNEKSNDSKPYLLYVGRVEDVKGIRTLIQAIKGMPFHLKIAGTGDASERFKEFVQKGNYRNVQFLGFQPKHSIFDLILNSMFVVCPSEWYENFPFSIIESFLFSKPVVASDIGGIPELVINGETGYLFEPGNVEDLRDKLLKLRNDEDLVKEMGVKARKHVCDIVNFETHWEGLQSIINNIISNDN
jgi:glycosyltransferase involved in cell wall biosynthesis